MDGTLNAFASLHGKVAGVILASFMYQGYYVWLIISMIDETCQPDAC